MVFFVMSVQPFFCPCPSLSPFIDEKAGDLRIDDGTFIRFWLSAYISHLLTQLRFLLIVAKFGWEPTLYENHLAY